jgi:hypothetical protein
MDFTPKTEHNKQRDFERGNTHLDDLIESLKPLDIEVYDYKNYKVETNLFKYKFYLSVSRLNQNILNCIWLYLHGWDLFFKYEIYPNSKGNALELTIWIK